MIILIPKDTKEYFNVKGYTQEADKNPHPTPRDPAAIAANIISIMVLYFYLFFEEYLTLKTLIFHYQVL